MGGVDKIFFDIDAVVPESALRLHLGGLERLGDLLLFMNDPHPPPSPAGDRLDDDGVTDFFRHFNRLFLAVHLAVASGYDGEPLLHHYLAGLRFVSHETDALRKGADKLDSSRLADFGEVAVFGEKTVSGMDRLRPGDFGRAENVGDIPIGKGGVGRPDADAFVGEPNMEGRGVDFGMDRYGPDSKFSTGANHPKRDLPAVGDQYFFKHLVYSVRAKQVGRTGRSPRPHRLS